MSREIEFIDTTGMTDYANVLNATGQWYNTVGLAFENFNAANWSQYKIAAAEFGVSGVYEADMPAVAAAKYNLVARRQTGGSPAQSDPVIGTGNIDWTGAIVASVGRSVPAVPSGEANGLPILGINTAGIQLAPTGGNALSLVSVNGSGLFIATEAAAPAALIQNSGGGSIGLAIVGDTGADAVQIGFAYNGNDSGGVSIGSDGGPALSLHGTNFPGLQITGDGTSAVVIDGAGGNGIDITGASRGLTIAGNGAEGVVISGTTTGLSVTGVDGVKIIASGTGTGLYVQGGNGSNARAARFAGLSTSASVLIDNINGTGGDALQLTVFSGNGNALNATGHGTGNGFLLTGGAGAGGDGLEAVAGGGVPIRGNLEGSVTSVVNGVLLAINAIDVSQITAAAANMLADYIRRRHQANVEGSAYGDSLDASSMYGMIQQAQNADTTTHAGKLTVFKTDNTELAQKDITSASANPITKVNQ